MNSKIKELEEYLATHKRIPKLTYAEQLIKSRQSFIKTLHLNESDLEAMTFWAESLIEKAYKDGYNQASSSIERVPEYNMRNEGY